MKTYKLIFLVLLIILSSCLKEKNKDGVIRIELHPMENDGKTGLRWSPKGEQIKLVEEGNTLLGKLVLGPESLDPVNLRLSKPHPDSSYNKLEVDINRDGVFGNENDTTMFCVPATTRAKVWSSFIGEVNIPFSKTKGQAEIVNPYPLSFWYVYDPLEPEAEKVLRYSRRGWMEGEAEIDGTKIRVLLTESNMDGVFRWDDSWAISYDSARNDLFQSRNAKAVDSHAWLGEQAIGVDSLLASGRSVWIKKVDPQITRAEEEAQKDFMAKDRAAKRSGSSVNFLHDFDEAVKSAKKQGKNLFVDFETTWCGPCKNMDKWVYTADDIVAASKNFACVKVDGDENRNLVKKFEVAGYPTLLIISPDGDILNRVTGYQSVENTLTFLK